MNIGSAKSFLRFENYIVEDIAFKINPFFDESAEKPKELDIEFNVHMDLSSEENRVRLNIVCTISNELFESRTAPFYLRVSVVGFFSVDSIPQDVHVDTVQRVLQKNSLAILFPYVRSIITSITSSANVSPLILPPINTASMVENQDNAGDQ